jgi:hypothetical protein
MRRKGVSSEAGILISWSCWRKGNGVALWRGLDQTYNIVTNDFGDVKLLLV